MLRHIFVVLAVSALAACGGHSSEPPRTVVLTAAAVEPEARVQRLASCPSAVYGATTVVAEVDGGVELLVTATNEDSIREIRRRAGALVAASAPDGRHRGNGTNGGRYGRCPVVMRNTSVTMRDITGGTRIFVQPRDAAELHWLRRETEARAATISDAARFGPGEMAICPNAVANAKTLAYETPYGMDVEITGPPEAVADIRERANRLANRAVSGERGSRCPLAVPRAILEVTEMPGGARVSVRAAGPDEVENVRRAVHDRSADFEAPRVPRMPTH